MRIGTKKPRPYKLLMMSLLTAGSAVIAGCGVQEAVPPPGELVLIAGDRQGVPSIVDMSGRRPEILISSMRQHLKNRFDRDVTVSFITVDGDSQTQAVARYELDTRNVEKRKESPENNILGLSSRLSDLHASSVEADVLGALDSGGRASSTATDKTLYVYDSGVSTAGPLAMQNGLIGSATDVSSIVKSLRGVGDIPELDGVTVHWWGLGQVVAPQSEIPIWAKSKLKDLWTAIVVEGGGTVEFHDDAIVASPPYGDLPAVTPVSFDEVEAKPVFRTIPESQLSFQPNSAEFADSISAESVLREVASTLESFSGDTLWVTGCTANPLDATEQGMKDVSELRARRVALELERLGIGTGLKVKGLGPACPGRSPETGSSSEVEAAQSKNRRVLITSRELLPVAVQD